MIVHCTMNSVRLTRSFAVLWINGEVKCQKAALLDNNLASHASSLVGLTVVSVCAWL